VPQHLSHQHCARNNISCSSYMCVVCCLQGACLLSPHFLKTESNRVTCM
jgi:hypothetical protein